MISHSSLTLIQAYEVIQENDSSFFNYLSNKKAFIFSFMFNLRHIMREVNAIKDLLLLLIS